uniref:Uncharacterized protein n=1 Tax=Lepeophtheirus salmonis TaxID=72036 RepID=A0A0K2U7M7_LEPSM
MTSTRSIDVVTNINTFLTLGTFSHIFICSLISTTV